MKSEGSKNIVRILNIVYKYKSKVRGARNGNLRSVCIYPVKVSCTLVEHKYESNCETRSDKTHVYMNCFIVPPICCWSPFFKKHPAYLCSNIYIMIILSMNFNSMIVFVISYNCLIDTFNYWKSMQELQKKQYAELYLILSLYKW